MKVKVGSSYIFKAVGLDSFRPVHRGLKEGDIVEVRNLPGTPPANTGGHCFVFRNDILMGLILCNSLQPMPKSLKRKNSRKTKSKTFVQVHTTKWDHLKG